MKKICILLCLILMLSFCFGGCGNSAQNSSGDSSKQEGSSPPQENSKSEISSKSEVSSKIEESSKAEESSSLSAQKLMRQAYREVIADLEAEHGTAHDGEGIEFYRQGLCMAKLIDFDKDGTPELFCSYSISVDVYCDEIYQFRDQEAVMIYQHQGANQGTFRMTL